MNYTLTVNGQRYETSKKKPFCTHVGTINWNISMIEVRLRVSYGVFKDVYGKKQTFVNEGIYTNKHDFIQALRAFLEA